MTSGYFPPPSAVRSQGRQYFGPEYDAGNSGSALEIDWNNGLTQLVTLTGNWTPTFVNPAPAPFVGRYMLIVTQGAPGGWTWTPPASLKWTGGTPAVLSTAAGAVTVVTLAWSPTKGYYIAAANLDVS